MKDPLEFASRTPQRPAERLRAIGITIMNSFGDLGEGIKRVMGSANAAISDYHIGQELMRERNSQLLADFAALPPAEQHRRLELGAHATSDMDLIITQPPSKTVSV